MPPTLLYLFIYLFYLFILFIIYLFIYLFYLLFIYLFYFLLLFIYWLIDLYLPLTLTIRSVELSVYLLHSRLSNAL